MNIEFVNNDYLLAWYLLFKPSINEEIQNLKVKLYQNYGKQYIQLEKENIEILKYNEDFIPDDDLLYNIVFESETFQKIKKETDKHRLYLMKIWDSNKKKVKEELKSILRFQVKDTYHLIVVHPKLDVIEFMENNPKNNISWGKSDDKQDELKTLMRIIFTIVKYELGSFNKEHREILSTILDLAITNELQTRIVGTSKYEEGFKNLKYLKKQIYPYFLMYLGADKEGLLNYMMRDKIVFDADKYPIEKELKKVDLFGFIDFVCKNQKYIIKLNNLN